MTTTLTWRRILRTAAIYAVVWGVMTIASAVLSQKDVGSAIVEAIPVWFAVVATVFAVGWTWRDREMRDHEELSNE